MTKPKFLTEKFIENAVRFAIYVLAIALTPFLAKPIAPLFDFIQFGSLRVLFTEVFTVIFWGIEALIFSALERARRAKAEGQAQEKEAAKTKQKSAPIPLKNVWILTGICAVCVLIVSIIIGFNVKIFYDFGEKFTGLEMYCTIGEIARNVFKCMWIVALLRVSKCMAEEVVAQTNVKEKWLWVLTGGILMLYGLFDVFTSVASYPMDVEGAFLAVAYLLFYVAFTAVYYFTEENKVKAYFLILFIYLF